MNAGLVFLLFVAWRLMVVESLNFMQCFPAPPFTTPEINFVLGSGDVCASSDKDFGIVGPAVQQYTFVGGFFPRATGEMACVVPTTEANKLFVFSNSPNPSAGRAELSVTTTNGMTFNFSLFYTSGAVLPISSPTLTFSEGDEVTMTWLHFFNRPNLTLYHYTPDGRIRTFPISSMFGDVAGASGEYLNDLQPACATNQMQVATRSIIIKNLTAALGGSYALVYSNETAENALANITVAVLPAPTPPASPVIISTPTTASDTPSSTGSNIVVSTSQTPTILPSPAPIAGIIIGVILATFIIVAGVLIAVTVIGFIVCKGRKRGKGVINDKAVSRSPITTTFSTPGTPAQPEYTGVYAIGEYTHIKKKMLDKYKDMVRDIKNKDDMIEALLDPLCKEIYAFAGSNGNTDWDDIFREVESRAFCPNHKPPKITRVIFADSDPTDGHYVETGRVRFTRFEGEHDEPDILAKLMMIGDRPVLKKEMPQTSSQGTLITQDSRYSSRDEPDVPSTITEEHTFQIPPGSNGSSPATAPVVGKIDLSGSHSGSQSSTSSPTKQDRHEMADTNMQRPSAKPRQVAELVKESQLKSASGSSIGSRVEVLLVETIELHKKEISLMESISQHTKKAADKAEEQTELLAEQIQVADPPPPSPVLP